MTYSMNRDSLRTTITDKSFHTVNQYTHAFLYQVDQITIWCSKLDKFPIMIKDENDAQLQ